MKETKEVKAKLSSLRISPRKVRMVANLIRGESVLSAKAQLSFTTKKSAPILLKLLNSAISNAKHNFNLSEKNLYLQEILVNEGPRLKRWRPVWRGMAHSIIKRTSHIILTLGIKEKVDKKNGTKS